MNRQGSFDGDSLSTECQESECDVDERQRADSFSLEFAASQWQRLVSNAEGLLVSLCKQGVPVEAKEQIQQWLFMKQECEGCFSADGSIVKEKGFSLGRIDEVTESESKSSIGKSEYSESEYSDSGAEIDDTVGSSQVEKRRQDFSEKLMVLMNRFRTITDEKIYEFVGPIEKIAIPNENPRLLVSTYNLLKKQRRKSILPSNEHEKLPLVEGSKRDFDLQSSLTQSKNKIKKFLKQLRKDDDQSLNSDEDSKKSKEKTKKSSEKSKDDKRAQRVSLEGSDDKKLCLLDNKNKLASLGDRYVCLPEERSLRDEITKLRFTRDFLVEQRKCLDVKLNKERSYTKSEQRRFLELDEAIEAIDATIEFKNGSICGRKSFEDKSWEEGEQMLLDRLMKLNEAEMRSLLFKYFQKTIDLREWGRKLEQEISEMDHRIEAQQWKIQALSGALQQANVENERRLVTVHREHEEKLHLMFRHYTGTGTGTSSSADTRTDEPRALPSTSLTPGSIPQQNLRKLQGLSSQHTTKVTRQKNKLIIQQQQKK